MTRGQQNMIFVLYHNPQKDDTSHAFQMCLTTFLRNTLYVTWGG
jgi:hypothetical protein